MHWHSAVPFSVASEPRFPASGAFGGAWLRYFFAGQSFQRQHGHVVELEEFEFFLRRRQYVQRLQFIFIYNIVTSLSFWVFKFSMNSTVKKISTLFLTFESNVIIFQLQSCKFVRINFFIWVIWLSARFELFICCPRLDCCHREI